MRKTHYYCDRCLKEVDKKNLYLVTIYSVPTDAVYPDNSRNVQIELCVDCLHEIEAIIHPALQENGVSRLTGKHLKAKEAV